MKTQIRQLVLAAALGIGVISGGAAMLGFGTIAGMAVLHPTAAEAKDQLSCSAYGSDELQMLTGQSTAFGGTLCSPR